ncbi:MAG: beta-ketoacyl-[acyl-carrier-protein] synthase family protein [Pseudomonadota bacterium]
MKTEVVITGMGVICSQASSVPELFGRLKSGLSSVRNHAGLAAHGVANPACAYIDDEVWARLEAEQAGRFCERLGPQARLAVDAAGQAVRHAGIDLAAVERKGLFVASNKYTLTSDHLLGIGRHYNAATDKVSLDTYLQDEGHDGATYFHKRQDMAALALAELHGFDDAIMTPGDACAAGGMSIGAGFRHIAHGELDVALVGATETMSNYVPLMGFSILGASAPEPSHAPEGISRPFDRERSGFVMGEGSAFLVLESLEHARERGATILARVSGFARQAEAYRITASPSDGSQYARCMQAALDDAGLDAAAIDHVNAHGTSTQQNDSCESAAIRQVFGARAARLPVTANKSALGHSLAASGAIEAVLSVASLREQTLLPTLNFSEADAQTEGLDIVRQARPMRIEHVMSNSFGFGGQNCVLILSSHSS